MSPNRIGSPSSRERLSEQLFTAKAIVQQRNLADDRVKRSRPGIKRKGRRVAAAMIGVCARQGILTMSNYEMTIGGRAVAAAGSFSVRNPATGDQGKPLRESRSEVQDAVS